MSSRARITATRTGLPGDGDVGVGLGGVVQAAVELDPEEREAAADELPNQGGALADPRREDERVEAARGDRHRGHRLRDAVREHAERERGVLVPSGGPGPELPHMRGAREAGEAGLVVQRVIEPVRVEGPGMEEVQQRSGVDGARARRHGHALQRAEAHRRVDGAAVANGGHRAAAAQMADDEPGRRDALCGPLHGEAVEAVPADAPLLAPSPRDGVGGGLGRDARVEGRVEDGDLRDGAERLGRLVDPADRGRVVERRNLHEPADGGANLAVDHDGVAEARAAVDDAVRDPVERGRVDPGQRAHRLARLVLRHQRQLQARRAGVDDEDPPH